jgi:hypothetical protein
MGRYKNVTFAIDPLVYQELRIFAMQQGLTIKNLVSYIMMKWLRKYTDRNEPDAILEALAREAQELKAAEKARQKLQRQRSMYPAIDPVKASRAKARQLASESVSLL